MVEEPMLMLGANISLDEDPLFSGSVKGFDFVLQLEAQLRVCFAKRRVSHRYLRGSDARVETVIK